MHLRPRKETPLQRRLRHEDVLRAKIWREFNPHREDPWRFPHDDLPGMALGATLTYPDRWTMRVRNAAFEAPKRYRVWATEGLVHVMRVK